MYINSQTVPSSSSPSATLETAWGRELESLLCEPESDWAWVWWCVSLWCRSRIDGRTMSPLRGTTLYTRYIATKHCALSSFTFRHQTQSVTCLRAQPMLRCTQTSVPCLIWCSVFILILRTSWLRLIVVCTVFTLVATHCCVHCLHIGCHSLLCAVSRYCFLTRCKARPRAAKLYERLESVPWKRLVALRVGTRTQQHGQAVWGSSDARPCRDRVAELRHDSGITLLSAHLNILNW